MTEFWDIATRWTGLHVVLIIGLSVTAFMFWLVELDQPESPWCTSCEQALTTADEHHPDYDPTPAGDGEVADPYDAPSYKGWAA